MGYYTEDGIFPPTPGMVRGVQEAVQLLQKAGHRVIQKIVRTKGCWRWFLLLDDQRYETKAQVEEWRPPGLAGINSLWGEFVLADHGHYFRWRPLYIYDEWSKRCRADQKAQQYLTLMSWDWELGLEIQNIKFNDHDHMMVNTDSSWLQGNLLHWFHIN